VTRSALVLTLLATTVATAVRAAPIDTITSAVAAEEKAPLERVRMFIERGDVIDVYYIDRLRPDRTHLIKNPRQDGGEWIGIGDQQWVRTGSGWQRSTMPSGTDVAPSMTVMLRQGLSGATENVQSDGGRVVEGTMVWSGAASCKGRLKLRTDAGGLPSSMRFEGTCGSTPTRFLESFSFNGPLSIEAPE
jgi:hypothetical protein